MCFYCFVFTILYTVLQLMYRYHPLMQHIFTDFTQLLSLIMSLVSFFHQRALDSMRTVC